MENLKCKVCNSKYIYNVGELKYHCVICYNINEYTIDEIANTEWFISSAAAMIGAMLENQSVRTIDVEADELIKKIRDSQPVGASSTLTDLLIEVVEFVRRNCYESK